MLLLFWMRVMFGKLSQVRFLWCDMLSLTRETFPLEVSEGELLLHPEDRERSERSCVSLARTAK
jgi:hypothetical protein